MMDVGEYGSGSENTRARTPANQSWSGRGTEGGAWTGAVNVNNQERTVSVAAGAIMGALGLTRRTVPGYFMAGLGGMLLYRGLTGHCFLYDAVDYNSAAPQGRAQPSVKEIIDRGFRIQQSFTINRSPAELFAVWRDFENLPRIMSHLESVRVINSRQSHWVIKAPAIAGRKVEWDAEVISEEPGAFIAWRSLPGADIDNVGQVSFEERPADRGTLVRVSINYLPPAGRAGKWFAELFGQYPSWQVREDLRAFKRTMEIGAPPQVVGQPKGTCSGEGEYSRE